MNDTPPPPAAAAALWPRPPTLTLSTNQPVALVAGAGVAARCVDAHLGGVAVVGVCFALVYVCAGRRAEEDNTTFS